MARESEKLGLPIPELLDTVNRDYFELLVTMIDNKVLGHDDKAELLQYLSDVVARIDKSIRDHANDYNIITSDTFDGSRAILSEYLANVKKAIGAMRIDILAGKKAGNVTTNKYYGSATARNVESSLDGIEKAMNKKDAELLEKINTLEATIDETSGAIDSLSSVAIKHGSTTVHDQLTKDNQRLKDLEDKVGTGLEAVNVKTARRYNGATPNVEDSLDALDKKINSLDGKLGGVVDNFTAASIATERSYQGSSKNVESALGAISKKADLNDERIWLLNTRVYKLETEGESGGSPILPESPSSSDKVTHSSPNIKASNVKDALEELFTYADDTHAKWASSVGKPLTKEMTALEKEKATSKLIKDAINEVNDFSDREVKSLQDIPGALWDDYKADWYAKEVGDWRHTFLHFNARKKNTFKLKYASKLVGFVINPRIDHNPDKSITYMSGFTRNIGVSSSDYTITHNQEEDVMVIELNSFGYGTSQSRIDVYYRISVWDEDVIEIT